MELRQLKKGDFFRIVTKGKTGNKTYIKGDFDRSEKRFLCSDCADVWGTGKYFKASQEVTADFEY